MIEKVAKEILNRIRKIQTPFYLKKNQIKLDDFQLKIIEETIRRNFFKGWRNEKYYTNETFMIDLQAHLTDRLEQDRIKYIPWFDKIIKLKGCNILEIGCGTGSSTVALAEQGAFVTGIDIDKDALKVAKDRCKIYNVLANLIHCNANEFYKDLKDQKFDLIIFFACIEHMTYDERIDCMRNYSGFIEKGAYLCIIDTPNRLWYFDDHTSLLPFFNWLPDRTAFDYSKFSHRINFKELYHEYSDEKFLHFLRGGRGFSFHELEIALNIPAEKFNIVDYLGPSLLLNPLGREFHKLLLKIHPGISKGFF